MRFSTNAIVVVQCALSVLFGNAATAQTHAIDLRLKSGARVRVSSSAPGSVGSARVGTVLAQHGDTISFRPEGTEDSLALPLKLITELEVSAGTHSHVGQGMGLGFLAGATMGGAFGATTYTPSGCYLFVVAE